MSVRPILLQKNGAIFGTPGAYRALPPKMAGLYAGSDLLEDVTYYTVNSSGEAELKTVKAYPFYVDSISGGADTSGDGTLANPWRSVNRALSTLQPILTCLSSKSCCTCLVLRVGGTVDYTIQYNNGSAFNGYNRFIIEPFEDEFIEIASLKNIEYSIFKNIKNFYESNADFYFYFLECHHSTLNNCEFYVDSSEIADVWGFLACRNTIFYKCKSDIKNSYNLSLGGDSFGFNSCHNSIFYETDTLGIIVGKGSAYGFFSMNNLIFYSCNGFVYHEGDGYAEGCGFFGNTNKIFLNCTGNSLNITNCDI